MIKFIAVVLLTFSVQVFGSRTDVVTTSHLLNAARECKTDQAIELAQTGRADLQASYPSGNSLLIMAAICDSPEMAKLLLDAGVKLDEESVVTATLNGRPAVLAVFLDNGLNPNTFRPKGRTLLIWAVEKLEWPSVELLLDHGADPTIKTESGLSVLDLLNAHIQSAEKIKLRLEQSE